MSNELKPHEKNLALLLSTDLAAYKNRIDTTSIETAAMHRMPLSSYMQLAELALEALNNRAPSPIDVDEDKV